MTEGANEVSDAEGQATQVGVPEQSAAGSAEMPEMSGASSSSRPEGDAIGEGVSWSEPEVLADDVAWDDDEIELLD